MKGDVTFSSYHLLEDMKFGARMDSDAFDCATMLVAALAHDVLHPGTNNQHELLLDTPLNKRYHSKSILENQSADFVKEYVATHDLFGKLKIETSHNQQDFVNRIATLILDTDMAFHMNHVKELNAIVGSQNDGASAKLRFHDEKTRTDMFGILLHAADISGSTRPTHIQSVWAKKITQEFEQQAKIEGDLGFPVASPGQQLFFVDKLVKPLFEGLWKLEASMKGYMDALDVYIARLTLDHSSL